MKKGRKPLFSDKQVERMRDMKKEGFRNHDIARVLNVSTGTISSYLRGKRRTS